MVGTCIRMGLQVGEETCRRRDYAAAAETSIPDVVLVEMEMDDTHKEGYTVVLGLGGICKLAAEESCSGKPAAESCSCKPEDV